MDKPQSLESPKSPEPSAPFDGPWTQSDVFWEQQIVSLLQVSSVPHMEGIGEVSGSIGFGFGFGFGSGFGFGVYGPTRKLHKNETMDDKAYRLMYLFRSVFGVKCAIGLFWPNVHEYYTFNFAQA